MSGELVLVERRDGVTLVTLNRPEVLNSFNRQMARELQEGLASAAADQTQRAVLITGAGRAFCAGQDLGDVLPKDGEPAPDLGEIVRSCYNPVIRAIRTIEKPVVCAVNGTAAGAGANLALACDIVFASTESSFIQSFARVGLVPDSGGTFILPRIVGLQRAAAMAMLCEKVTADQALAWGMVYRTVPPHALMEAAFDCAAGLARMPTRGLGLIKRGFNHSLGIALDEQLDFEEQLQREAGNTADYAEGVRAFIEKRPATFTGR